MVQKIKIGQTYEIDGNFYTPLDWSVTLDSRNGTRVIVNFRQTHEPKVFTDANGNKYEAVGTPSISGKIAIQPIKPTPLDILKEAVKSYDTGAIEQYLKEIGE